MDRINYLSAGLVPGLDVIAEDWSCLDGYVEKQDLAAERKKLSVVIAEINKVPMTRPEVLEAHRVSYENARRTYVEGKLAKFISENLTNPDPFRRMSRVEFFSAAWPSWEDIETAIESLPDAAFGSASEVERQAEAGKIRKRIAEIDQRVAELSCPPYLKQADRGLVDVREELVSFWVNRQSRCREPIDPQGIELRTAPPAIREWYGKLQIGKSVSTSPHALLAVTRG